MSLSGISFKRGLALLSIAVGLAHSTLAQAGIVLTNGVAKTGISGATGTSKFYEISVPAGATNLRFVTLGTTGDADIYVRYGTAPTLSAYDLKSDGSTSSEQVSIAAPRTGVYHLLLHGWAAYSSLSLTASFTAPATSTQPSSTQVLTLSTPSLTAQAGGTINLGMRFNAVPMSQDYQVFVHFVNSAGANALGADHAPPTATSRWSGAINYNRSVTLPANMANGTYSIRVGLYQNYSPYGRATLLMGSGVTTDGALRYTVATLTVGATQTTPPTTPTTPDTGTGTVSWTRCANENQTCSFSGTMQVRYGANGTYAYRTATGSIACNNATFGDPVPGVFKSCDYSAVPTTPTTPTTPTITQIQALSTPALTAQAGGSVTLGIRFNAVRMSAEYHGFIHFVDSSGTHRSEMNSGFIPNPPTTSWSEAISVNQTVPIPASVPAGTYSIRVGLYRPVAPYTERAQLAMGSGVTEDGTLRYLVGTLAVGPTTSPSSSVTLTGFQATSDATNVTYQYNFTGTINFHRLLLDTDNNPATGYAADGIGGNYLIENGTLYEHSGAATAWTWSEVKQITVTSTASSMRLTVARADLGSPSTIKMIARIAGSAGEAFSPVVMQTLTSPTPSITLTVQGAPNLPLNGTTTLVTVGFVDGIPTNVDLSRDGYSPFASWPSGTFFTLASDGKSLTGNWCVSSDCWGGVSGAHVLNVVATYANGMTKSASVNLNVADAVPPAQAFYVSPSGNDANSGSQSAPWRTIQKAANTLVAGDTAILMDGVYEEGSINFMRSGVAGKPITFKAQNKWQAIVSSTSGCNPGFSISASYIKVVGISFTVSANSPGCGTYTSTNVHIRAWDQSLPTASNPTTGYVGFHADEIKVSTAGRHEGVKSNQDFTIVENSEFGNSMELFNNKDSIVRNNHFIAQGYSGISIFAKGGVRSARIHNNVIRNKVANWGTGIYLGGATGREWFYDSNAQIEAYNSVAYNNVVVNEGGSNFNALVFSGAKDSAFLNNVVIGGKVAMIRGGTSQSGAATSNPIMNNNIFICKGSYDGGISYSGTAQIDYNNFYDCSGAPAQAHPITGNPFLVNQSTDFHLSPGSPAINSGTAITFRGFDGNVIDISHDMDGVVRSAPWDLGVYNVTP